MLPYFSMLWTTFSGGIASFFETNSLIRLLAWCGIEEVEILDRHAIALQHGQAHFGHLGCGPSEDMAAIHGCGWTDLLSIISCVSRGL